MTDECPGENGFVCIGGWLYTPVNMMIFPTNRKCPVCNAKPNEQPPPIAASGEGAADSTRPCESASKSGPAATGST
jgi:hypothetical protein